MVLTCVARLFPRLNSIALLCGSRITPEIFAERMAALSITSIQLQASFGVGQLAGWAMLWDRRCGWCLVGGVARSSGGDSCSSSSAEAKGAAAATAPQNQGWLMPTEYTCARLSKRLQHHHQQQELPQQTHGALRAAVGLVPTCVSRTSVRRNSMHCFACCCCASCCYTSGTGVALSVSV